jgi:hypothetical protein
MKKIALLSMAFVFASSFASDTSGTDTGSDDDSYNNGCYAALGVGCQEGGSDEYYRWAEKTGDSTGMDVREAGGVGTSLALGGKFGFGKNFGVGAHRVVLGLEIGGMVGRTVEHNSSNNTFNAITYFDASTRVGGSTAYGIVKVGYNHYVLGFSLSFGAGVKYCKTSSKYREWDIAGPFYEREVSDAVKAAEAARVAAGGGAVGAAYGGAYAPPAGLGAEAAAFNAVSVTYGGDWARAVALDGGTGAGPVSAGLVSDALKKAEEDETARRLVAAGYAYDDDKLKNQADHHTTKFLPYFVVEGSKNLGHGTCLVLHVGFALGSDKKFTSATTGNVTKLRTKPSVDVGVYVRKDFKLFN